MRTVAFGLICACSAVASAQTFSIRFPAMPQPDDPNATVRTYQWPSRFAGCGEQVSVVLDYWVDWGAVRLYGQGSEPLLLKPPYFFSGWGADVRQLPLVEPPLGTQPPSTLFVDGLVLAADWRAVPRTRDGDGLAGVAWPSPVAATELNGSGEWVPGPGDPFYPGRVALGTVTLKVPENPIPGDAFVYFASTPGDVTEGVMPLNGRLNPYEDRADLLATSNPQDYLKWRTLIRIVPFRRCKADIAGPNQSNVPDGFYTADDIIVFLSLYFAQHPLADVASANQVEGPDGFFTADDTIVFLGWYFAGCQAQAPCGTAGRAAAPGSGARAASRSGTGGAAPEALPLYDAATVIAMQQLIDTLPAGAQRDAMQTQLNARTPGASPAPSPSPASDDR